MRIVVTSILILSLFACRRSETATTFEKTSRTDVASVAQRFIPADSKGATAAAEDRMIIRSANLSMIVSDTSAAIEKITLAAEGAGGYVSDSRVWRDGELLRGTMSLRVPSSQLTATLAAIRKFAVRIQSESLGSQEVTQEYVDLESQLRNLEATENELRMLMTVVRERARKASEVLEMHQQLQSIRGQIEQTKGRMRYLSQMSEFASVGLELVPDAIAQPVVQPGWQPLVVVKDAGRALVVLLQTVANALIWLGIYILPLVTLLLIAVVAIRKAALRFIQPRVDAM
jgi:hypothetical protein